LKEDQEAFKNDLLTNPDISMVAHSNTIPGKPYTERSYRRKGDNESFAFKFNHVSYTFRELMGLQMISGRFFSKEHGMDSNAVVINEAAAKAFGFKNPIGHELTSPWHKGEFLTIIGVIKDFNIESLHKKIEPIAMELMPENSDQGGYIMVRIRNAENIRKTVQFIENTWSKHSNGKLFESFFFDDDYENLYKSEFTTGKVLVVFATLTIFIACLGLVALLAFTASVRRKEIGIRKVLGASVTGIVGMLSKDFLKLVFIAAIIAFPVAWWAMSRWLEDFAYRVSITWWVFCIAGILALLIAVLTVSFQAIKAAIANPVESLRTE
jgi:putative ABC transport system permease protein